MRTISIRIEFDSLVEDGSYDAVETCRLNCFADRVVN